MQDQKIQITWYGTASVRISAGNTSLLVDPFIPFPDSSVRLAADAYADCGHILITHGHYDHIEGLRLCTMKAPVYVHLLEEEFLVEPAYNLSLDFLDNLYIRGLKTVLFIDGDILNIGKYRIKVIHTPFHTRGSSCFYFEDEHVLFSGDTLFHLSVGRTDLLTGSPRTLESSLKKLIVLPPETKVYPGHGPSTTIGDELRLNPYLKRLKR